MFKALKTLLQDPPPAMAFEISEAGIAAARIGARAEVEFQPFKAGVLAVSPVKENVIDPDEFVLAVRQSIGGQGGRKRRDAALILPDYATRTAVLDFDHFPGDAKEQAALIRFRLKRSVPFDTESAALSWVAQPPAGGKTDVVVVMAPLEIVARYEAPFRGAGLNPGLVTTSSLAALELAPEQGLTVLAKLSGRVLSVLVREGGALKLVRCLELGAGAVEDIAAVLVPTFVYIEDNLGRAAEKLWLCGFGSEMDAGRRLSDELRVETGALVSPLGEPGENNAGLLGYLYSLSKN